LFIAKFPWLKIQLLSNLAQAKPSPCSLFLICCNFLLHSSYEDLKAMSAWYCSNCHTHLYRYKWYSRRSQEKGGR
jgi:hypothetical protein